MVRIVQINLGRRPAAVFYLNDLINLDNYGIALIQEPYTYKNIIGKLNKNGVAYQNSMYNENPRACIWINNDLARCSKAIQLLEFSDKDCVAVKMNLVEIDGIREIILCSAYFPGINECGNNVISDKLNKLIKYCSSNHTELVVGCDANAHHIIWGSKNECLRGKILLEYLSLNNLFLINEGDSPTWERGNLQDVIDLTFATRNVSRKVLFWKVLDQDSNSDHNYISMEIKTSKIEKEKFRSKRKTNWAGFRSTLSRLLSIPAGNIENPDDLDNEAEYLTKSLVDSFHLNCKLMYKNSSCQMKWQTVSLLNDKKVVRKLHNRARRKKVDEEAWKEWRTLRDEYNKKCRKAAADCWKKDMTEMENISEIARLQKLMENRSAKKLGTLKRSDGNYTKSCEENNLELLQTHFPDCEIIDSYTTFNEGATFNNFNSELDTKYINDLTTKEKILWAVNSFSPYKAAGEDKIFPALLQKSADILEDRLQILFRNSLRMSYIPKCWRGTHVVFIPKVGKPNYEVAKAYRPISLMSFLLKTLEKLIDKHVRLYDLKVNKLNSKQFAYQEGKGTETALHDIITTIEKSLKKREIALGVFIDIEGAFDSTAFSTIEKAARDKGVSDIAIRWTKSMLANRIVKARTDESRISIKPVKGCPQGGCLSPLLWCLVADSLIYELESKGCHVTAYADDFALVSQGKTAEKACVEMNKYMKIVENWCARNQLHVNPSKTTMVRFTRCTSEVKIKMDQVKLFGEVVKTDNCFKYLGVYLDSKLLMNKHIDECVTKGLRSLWASRSMVSRTWGMNPLIASWLYKQVIVPRITYGSIIWWHRANLKTYAQRLDKIHRLALLMITGAMKSTPTLGMGAALDILPLNIMVELRARECHDRLKLAETWISESELFGHGKIALPNGIVYQQENFDNCTREWNFGKEFKTEILDRNEWDKNLLEATDPLTWFTDGSKTDNATGCGIYCEQLQKERLERLSDHASIMQAETLAVKICAEEMIQSNISDKNIYIFTDSQATIKAISKSTINTLSVKECVNELNSLGISNNLTVSWVPGHSGIPGNEKADELANKGTNLDNISIVTPAPGCIKVNKIKSWGEKLFKDLWNRQRGLKHSKMMMEPFKKGKYDLVKMKRRDLRVIIGLLTGHSCLKKFLNRIGKSDDTICSYCQEDEDEDMTHLLTGCPALARIRLTTLGVASPSEAELKEMNPLSLLKFAKQSYIYDTFFF